MYSPRHVPAGLEKEDGRGWILNTSYFIMLVGFFFFHFLLSTRMITAEASSDLPKLHL